LEVLRLVVLRLRVLEAEHLGIEAGRRRKVFTLLLLHQKAQNS
jgi:hypothetical protein